MGFYPIFRVDRQNGLQIRNQHRKIHRLKKKGAKFLMYKSYPKFRVFWVFTLFIGSTDKNGLQIRNQHRKMHRLKKKVQNF